jgi:hypothetical protein
MKPHRVFNRFFLGASLSSLWITSLANVLIDPYGIFGSPTWDRLNRIKPETLKQARLFKAVEIHRVQPKALLLGSSRTDIGLDPTHPALASLQPAYNLSLPGASMYELRRYFEHALLTQTHPELLILGLDLQSFRDSRLPQEDFNEARLYQPTLLWGDALRSTLSWDALRSSGLTLWRNLDDTPANSYRYQGMQYNVSQQVSPLTFQNSLFNPKPDQGDGLYEAYKSFRYQDSLLELHQILALCKERQIQTVLLISPAHASEWEAFHYFGLWPTFEQWKRDLVQMAPVWDFSGYNSITTETIGPHMQYYTDTSHYTRAAGDLVLDRVLQDRLDRVPADFGVLITADTVEAHLTRINADRDLLLQSNSDLIQWVRQQYELPTDPSIVAVSEQSLISESNPSDAL